MTAFAFLAIQYVLTMSFSLGGGDSTFGTFDAILHSLFAMQTITVLIRIYFFIFASDNRESMKDRDAMLVRSLDNFIIVSSVIILGLNAVSVFGIFDLLN